MKTREMASKRITNAEILEALKNLAARLGQSTLSKRDVQSRLAGVVTYSTLLDRFGSLGAALEAAGLEVAKPGSNFRNQGEKYSNDELFLSLKELEDQIGRFPTQRQYNAQGRFSPRPFIKRFGKWSSAILEYKRWKQSQTESDSPGISSATASEQPDGSAYSVSDEPTVDPAFPASHRKSVVNRSTVIYGEPINFRGLIHAPVNEQGVVYLFGMISRELGFNIEAVQQGFPDCEGKILTDRRRRHWRRVFIEFEFKASNFREHGHDAEQCDLIVCWENDWPEAPIEVIELKSEILKLNSK